MKLKKALSLLLALIMVMSSFSAFTASAASKTAKASASTSAVSAKKLSKCKITVASSVKFTGKALKPKVKVTDGKKVLKEGKQYTLKYSSNKKIGTAKVTVTAVKNSGYTGSKTLSFKIVPAKVTSLAASKQTASSVKLTWKAVKGATGYAVYSYDAKTKKYSKIKTTAKTALTVSKLAADTKYTFAVRAFAKADKKTFYGAYSAKLKAATLKTAEPKPEPTPTPTPQPEPHVEPEPQLTAYRVEKCSKLFEDGEYLIEFTTNDPELGDAPITVAAKNGNISVTTNIESLSCRMLYLAKDKTTYLLIDDFYKYTKIPDSLMESDGFDMGQLGFRIIADDSSPKEIKVYEVNIDGQPIICEKYIYSDGHEAIYFFNGENLVRVDEINTDGSVASTFVSKITSEVPDSMFEIPEGYGFLNLSWLETLA